MHDDGPGIDEAHYEEVLQPFTRLDPSRNQNKGSGVGLGLPIAKQIARRPGRYSLKLSKSEYFIWFERCSNYPNKFLGSGRPGGN